MLFRHFMFVGNNFPSLRLISFFRWLICRFDTRLQVLCTFVGFTLLQYVNLQLFCCIEFCFSCRPSAYSHQLCIYLCSTFILFVGIILYPPQKLEFLILVLQSFFPLEGVFSLKSCFLPLNDPNALVVFAWLFRFSCSSLIFSWRRFHHVSSGKDNYDGR